MSTQKLPPITAAAFGQPGDPPGPTPIEREWSGMPVQTQDLVVCWAGQWIRGQTGLTWSWVRWNKGPESRSDLVTRTPAASVKRLLSPLAHEGRIRLMQAMHDGPKGSGQLSELTGLKGGNLYYHLKELLHGGYVRDEGGLYDLTLFGCQMLATVVSIADTVVQDRGPEGLAVNLRAAGIEGAPEA
ncbi:MAG: winged helix-turn-helix domain-containing protein [Candidatus Latescibacterota bacterium]